MWAYFSQVLLSSVGKLIIINHYLTTKLNIFWIFFFFKFSSLFHNKRIGTGNSFYFDPSIFYSKKVKKIFSLELIYRKHFCVCVDGIFGWCIFHSNFFGLLFWAKRYHPTWFIAEETVQFGLDRFNSWQQMQNDFGYFHGNVKTGLHHIYWKGVAIELANFLVGEYFLKLKPNVFLQIEQISQRKFYFSGDIINLSLVCYCQINCLNKLSVCICTFRNFLWHLWR